MNDELYVLFSIEVGNLEDGRTGQISTEWANFHNQTTDILKDATKTKVEIQELAENTWLIPLEKGLPFVYGLKKAAGQRKYEARLIRGAVSKIEL
jgi:hypothetical protein